MTSSYKSCLKCRYTRTAADESIPIIMCPKCGAIYAKVEAALQAKTTQAGDALVSPPAVSPNSTPRPELATNRATASATPRASAATAGAAIAAPSEETHEPDDDIGIVPVDAEELKAAPIAHLIYATQLIAPLLTWIMQPSLMSRLLVFVLPIAAVVVAYVKRTPDRDSWLDSHFTWQIRTFWIGMIAGAVLLVIALAFGAMTLQGFTSGSGGMATGFYGLIAIGLLLIVVGLWLLFRILKGWIRLFKNEWMD
jgi:uncharacterized membrane protein